MNRKGFTLVEIIGVVTVLALILIVAVPSLTKTLKRNEQKKYDDYIDNLKMAAENYVVSKLKEGLVIGDYFIVSLGDLIDSGYVNDTVTNPQNDQKLTRNTIIKVKKDLDNTFKYNIKEFYQLLPNEYQQVEYIESESIDTSHGQSINTNWFYEPLKDNEYVEISIQGVMTKALQQRALFGIQKEGYGQQLYFYYCSLDKTCLYIGGSPSARFDTVKIGEEYDIKLNLTSKSATVVQNNKEVLKYTHNGNISQQYALRVFSGTNGNDLEDCSNHRISSFVISKNGIKERDLIPCYRKEDGVIGMYDMVEGKFYENSGTTEKEFKKGVDINA